MIKPFISGRQDVRNNGQVCCKVEKMSLQVQFYTMFSPFVQGYDICMKAAINSETRHVIRHPLEIPIEVQSLGAQARDCLPVRNTGLAELAFNFPRRINVGEVIMVRIPSINESAEICGKVIWLAKSADGYVIGVSLYSENEAFRMRMLEQICHIEVYRKKVLAGEGRKLTSEEAAAEWVACYAASFPNALPMAA
jgi:hypothetical protein